MRGRVRKCNWSCISGVGVVQPPLELRLQGQSCVAAIGAMLADLELDLEMSRNGWSPYRPKR